jgi:hypothetical protein
MKAPATRPLCVCPWKIFTCRSNTNTLRFTYSRNTTLENINPYRRWKRLFLITRSKNGSYLGLPGTGKSTFIRYLALRVAQEMVGRPRQLEHWQGPAVLPLLFRWGGLLRPCRLI